MCCCRGSGASADPANVMSHLFLVAKSTHGQPQNRPWSENSVSACRFHPRTTYRYSVGGKRPLRGAKKVGPPWNQPRHGRRTSFQPVIVAIGRPEIVHSHVTASGRAESAIGRITRVQWRLLQSENRCDMGRA